MKYLAGYIEPTGLVELPHTLVEQGHNGYARLHEEVHVWLIEENIKYRFRVSWNHKYFVYIENEVDFVKFKLKWI